MKKQTSSINNSPLWRGGTEGDGVVSQRNTQNYFKLPYNPNLKERAKKLRQAGNLSEVLLWNQFKNKQFKGLDFDRQKIIGNYIVDFFNASNKVVIEVDGQSHDDKHEYDKQRDLYLTGLGLCVIHILDIDVKQNIVGVIELLSNHPALKGTPPKRGISSEKVI